MLEDHIKNIRDGIRVGHFKNEASISQGIVLRILHALLWPTYDTQVVYPEYPLTGRRVDFALCHPPGKPMVFVEVKPVGKSNAGERQLFEYAFHQGVPMAILTDGQEWHFFLPGEQGDYKERRVYKLDIVERDVEEIVSRLERYLKYDAICSGATIEAAKDDCKDVARDRIIRSTLPQAWSKLIEGKDEFLIEVVAERVESLCGYKPDPDTVASFLANDVVLHPTTTAEGTRPVPPESPHGIGFSFGGRFYPARYAYEVLSKVLAVLADRDPRFLDQFANLKKDKKYPLLARSREELFLGLLNPAGFKSVKVSSGWWLRIKCDKKWIDKIIKLACEVAQIRYGTDLIVNLGNCMLSV